MHVAATLAELQGKSKSRGSAKGSVEADDHDGGGGGIDDDDDKSDASVSA